MSVMSLPFGADGNGMNDAMTQGHGQRKMGE
jgi:hypothetical protein